VRIYWLIPTFQRRNVPLGCSSGAFLVMLERQDLSFVGTSLLPCRSVGARWNKAIRRRWWIRGTMPEDRCCESRWYGWRG